MFSFEQFEHEVDKLINDMEDNWEDDWEDSAPVMRIYDFLINLHHEIFEYRRQKL